MLAGGFGVGILRIGGALYVLGGRTTNSNQ
jgi:hypothetical protein